MDIQIPKTLTLEDLALPQLHLSLGQLNEITTHSHLNREELQKILEGNYPMIQDKSYPPSFVKIFLLIKLNSLSQKEANVPSSFLRAMVKLYNENSFSQIWASQSEQEIFSQVINLTNDHDDLSKEDLEQILEGNALLIAINAWMILQTKNFLKKDEIAFTLSFTALGGRTKAFLPIVHREKNHKGQAQFAQTIFNFTKLEESHTSSIEELKVQDPYSMRCAPHVHGVAYDSLQNLQSKLSSLMNRLHCKFLIINGKKLPNLLVESDSSALKLDYLLCSLQEIGAISFLRSERILNSYLGKNKINQQSPEYASLASMLKSGIHLASRNKVLSEMGNFDTMNISHYNSDIFYSKGNYFSKCQQLLQNLYTLMTLEILSSIEALRSLYNEKVEFIFRHENLEKNFKFLNQNLSAINKRQSLEKVRNEWMAI